MYHPKIHCIAAVPGTDLSGQGRDDNMSIREYISMRNWQKVREALASDKDMATVKALAEKAAHHDRTCTECSLYGDYLVVDYEPKDARVEAWYYLFTLECGDDLKNGMPAPVWARLSQMIATAFIFEEQGESDPEELAEEAEKDGE